MPQKLNTRFNHARITSRLNHTISLRKQSRWADWGRIHSSSKGGALREAFIIRAVSEGLMTVDEAKEMSIELDTENATPLTLIQRRAFFKLPLAERQKLLAAQAEKMVTHYETDPDWNELGSTEIVE